MKRLGKQPARYTLFLNPYRDVRFSACPGCGAKTRQRKLPLVIHVDPMDLIALNKTCRFCPACDLLIVHRDEIEALLAAHFSAHEPEVIGNDYLIIGTLDRSDWRKGCQVPLSLKEMIEHLHDFKESVRFEMQRAWMPAERT